MSKKLLLQHLIKLEDAHSKISINLFSHSISCSVDFYVDDKVQLLVQTSRIKINSLIYWVSPIISSDESLFGYAWKGSTE